MPIGVKERYGIVEKSRLVSAHDCFVWVWGSIFLKECTEDHIRIEWPTILVQYIHFWSVTSQYNWIFLTLTWHPCELFETEHKQSDTAVVSCGKINWYRAAIGSRLCQMSSSDRVFYLGFPDTVYFSLSHSYWLATVPYVFYGSSTASRGFLDTTYVMLWILKTM